MDDTKMTILVPTNWHKNLKIEAALRGTTIKDIVITAVDELLKQNPVPKEVEKDG
jgi:hypothetical protein